MVSRGKIRKNRLCSCCSHIYRPTIAPTRMYPLEMYLKSSIRDEELPLRIALYDLGIIFRGEGKKTTDTVLTTVTRLKIGACKLRE